MCASYLSFTTVVPACSCEVGWVPTADGTCSKCAYGYYQSMDGARCIPCTSCTGAASEERCRALCGISCPLAVSPDTNHLAVCGDRGTCDVLTRVCTCNIGYTGASCGSICPLSPSGLLCGGRGQCVGTKCSCSAGWGGPTCEHCDTGYTSTPVWTALPFAVVATNGQTVMVPPYEAGGCDVSIDPRHVEGFAGPYSMCSPGYGGLACNETCASLTAAVCSGHGECIGDFMTLPKCHCLPSYYGASCERLCRDEACPGHGVCNSGGTCTCLERYLAPDCTTCQPGTFGPSSGCLGVCNCVNGDCDPITGACACHQDEVTGYWTGPTCDACVNANANPWLGCKLADTTPRYAEASILSYGEGNVEWISRYAAHAVRLPLAALGVEVSVTARGVAFVPMSRRRVLQQHQADAAMGAPAPVTAVVEDAQRVAVSHHDAAIPYCRGTSKPVIVTSSPSHAIMSASLVALDGVAPKAAIAVVIASEPTTGSRARASVVAVTIDACAQHVTIAGNRSAPVSLLTPRGRGAEVAQTGPRIEVIGGHLWPLSAPGGALAMGAVGTPTIWVLNDGTVHASAPTDVTSGVPSIDTSVPLLDVSDLVVPLSYHHPFITGYAVGNQKEVVVVAVNVMPLAPAATPPPMASLRALVLPRTVWRMAAPTSALVRASPAVPTGPRDALAAIEPGTWRVVHATAAALPILPAATFRLSGSPAPTTCDATELGPVVTIVASPPLDDGASALPHHALAVAFIGITPPSNGPPPSGAANHAAVGRWVPLTGPREAAGAVVLPPLVDVHTASAFAVVSGGFADPELVTLSLRLGVVSGRSAIPPLEAQISAKAMGATLVPHARELIVSLTSEGTQGTVKFATFVPLGLAPSSHVTTTGVQPIIVGAYGAPYSVGKTVPADACYPSALADSAALLRYGYTPSTTSTVCVLTRSMPSQDVDLFVPAVVLGDGSVVCDTPPILDDETCEVEVLSVAVGDITMFADPSGAAASRVLRAKVLQLMSLALLDGAETAVLSDDDGSGATASAAAITPNLVVPGAHVAIDLVGLSYHTYVDYAARRRLMQLASALPHGVAMRGGAPEPPPPVATLGIRDFVAGEATVLCCFSVGGPCVTPNPAVFHRGATNVTMQAVGIGYYEVSDSVLGARVVCTVPVELHPLPPGGAIMPMFGAMSDRPTPAPLHSQPAPTSSALHVGVSVDGYSFAELPAFAHYAGAPALWIPLTSRVTVESYTRRVGSDLISLPPAPADAETPLPSFSVAYMDSFMRVLPSALLDGHSRDPQIAVWVVPLDETASLTDSDPAIGAISECSSDIDDATRSHVHVRYSADHTAAASAARYLVLPRAGRYAIVVKAVLASHLPLHPNVTASAAAAVAAEPALRDALTDRGASGGMPTTDAYPSLPTSVTDLAIFTMRIVPGRASRLFVTNALPVRLIQVAGRRHTLTFGDGPVTVGMLDAACNVIPFSESSSYANLRFVVHVTVYNMVSFHSPNGTHRNHRSHHPDGSSIGEFESIDAALAAVGSLAGGSTALAHLPAAAGRPTRSSMTFGGVKALVFHFDNVTFPVLHGIRYFVDFRVLGAAADALSDASVDVGPIEAAACPDQYVPVALTTSCAPCPYGATCDGATARPQDGFWSPHPDSTRMYPCEGPCARGECVHPFTGPFCAGCVDGFVRMSVTEPCTACPQWTLATLQIITAFIILVAASAVMTFISVRMPAASWDAFPPALIIVHAAVSDALLSLPALPLAVRAGVSYVTQWLSARPIEISLRCVFGTVGGLITTAYVLPLMACGISVGVYAALIFAARKDPRAFLPDLSFVPTCTDPDALLQEVPMDEVETEGPEARRARLHAERERRMLRKAAGLWSAKDAAERRRRRRAADRPKDHERLISRWILEGAIAAVEAFGMRMLDSSSDDEDNDNAPQQPLGVTFSDDSPATARARPRRLKPMSLAQRVLALGGARNSALRTPASTASLATTTAANTFTPGAGDDEVEPAAVSGWSAPLTRAAPVPAVDAALDSCDQNDPQPRNDDGWAPTLFRRRVLPWPLSRRCLVNDADTTIEWLRGRQRRAAGELCRAYRSVAYAFDAAAGEATRGVYFTVGHVMVVCLLWPLVAVYPSVLHVAFSITDCVDVHVSPSVSGIHRAAYSVLRVDPTIGCPNAAAMVFAWIAIVLAVTAPLAVLAVAGVMAWRAAAATAPNGPLPLVAGHASSVGALSRWGLLRGSMRQMGTMTPAKWAVLVERAALRRWVGPGGYAQLHPQSLAALPAYPGADRLEHTRDPHNAPLDAQAAAVPSYVFDHAAAGAAALEADADPAAAAARKADEIEYGAFVPLSGLFGSAAASGPCAVTRPTWWPAAAALSVPSPATTTTDLTAVERATTFLFSTPEHPPPPPVATVDGPLPFYDRFVSALPGHVPRMAVAGSVAAWMFPLAASGYSPTCVWWRAVPFIRHVLLAACAHADVTAPRRALLCAAIATGSLAATFAVSPYAPRFRAIYLMDLASGALSVAALFVTAISSSIDGPDGSAGGISPTADLPLLSPRPLLDGWPWGVQTLGWVIAVGYLLLAAWAVLLLADFAVSRGVAEYNRIITRRPDVAYHGGGMAFLRAFVHAHAVGHNLRTYAPLARALDEALALHDVRMHPVVARWHEAAEQAEPVPEPVAAPPTAGTAPRRHSLGLNRVAPADPPGPPAAAMAADAGLHPAVPLSDDSARLSGAGDVPAKGPSAASDAEADPTEALPHPTAVAPDGPTGAGPSHPTGRAAPLPAAGGDVVPTDPVTIPSSSSTSALRGLDASPSRASSRSKTPKGSRERADEKDSGTHTTALSLSSALRVSQGGGGLTPSQARGTSTVYRYGSSPSQPDGGRGHFPRERAPSPSLSARKEEEIDYGNVLDLAPDEDVLPTVVTAPVRWDGKYELESTAVETDHHRFDDDATPPRGGDGGQARAGLPTAAPLAYHSPHPHRGSVYDASPINASPGRSPGGRRMADTDAFPSPGAASPGTPRTQAYLAGRPTTTPAMPSYMPTGRLSMSKGGASPSAFSGGRSAVSPPPDPRAPVGGTFHPPRSARPATSDAALAHAGDGVDDAFDVPGTPQGKLRLSPTLPGSRQSRQ